MDLLGLSLFIPLTPLQVAWTSYFAALATLAATIVTVIGALVFSFFFLSFSFLFCVYRFISVLLNVNLPFSCPTRTIDSHPFSYFHNFDS